MTGQEFAALLTEYEIGEYMNAGGSEIKGRILKLIAGNYGTINQELFDLLIAKLIECSVLELNSQRHTELLVYRPS